MKKCDSKLNTEKDIVRRGPVVVVTSVSSVCALFVNSVVIDSPSDHRPYAVIMTTTIIRIIHADMPSSRNFGENLGAY